MTDDMDHPDEQPTGELETVTNKRGETYTIGVDARRLANGAILAVDTGRIVANPAATGRPGGSGITTLNNSDLRAKWYERKLASQLAAGRGMATATLTPSELDAWEKLSERMASLVMDRNDRVSVEAYRALGSAAGFITQDTRRDDPGGPAGVSIELSPAAVDGLLALVQAWRAGQEGDE